MKYTDDPHTISYELVELKDVLLWIADNCDDTEAMDKINRSVYPHTTRYQQDTRR